MIGFGGTPQVFDYQPDMVDGPCSTVILPHIVSPDGHAEPVKDFRLVHKPGSEVTIWGGPKARIEAVLIEDGKVSYKVRFWNGSALATGWVDENMIEGDAPKTAIGFKRIDS